MARIPLETTQPNTEITEVQDKNINELIEAGQQTSVAQAAVMDSFNTIESLGVIKAASFMKSVSEKMIAETAISLKQSKKYRDLPYKDDEGNVKYVSDFSEFCEVFLGKTYRRVHQLVENYNTLGPELYEQAERLGFRQRDYAALKALPDDDRQLIAQAIEEENLEKALDVMQEMAAKHLREKESLTKQAEDLHHTLAAKDQVIQDKTEELNRKSERLAVLECKKRNEPAPSPEQRLLDLRSNLQISAAAIKTNVMTDLRKNVKALAEYAEETATSETGFMASCLIEIGRELAILRAEYDLPSAVDEDPIDPIWKAMAAGDELEVPGAAEFAARMAQQDSE